MCEDEGEGPNGNEYRDLLRIGQMRVFQIDSARLAGREQFLDFRAARINGQRYLCVGIGGDEEQLRTRQPCRSELGGRTES